MRSEYELKLLRENKQTLRRPEKKIMTEQELTQWN